MKTMIVYDSTYGNTEKIAKAIATAMISPDQVAVLRVSEANPAEWTALELLIVGSPTLGGRPTPAIQEFINKIPVNALKNVEVTAFDTRFSTQEHGLALRMLMGLLGYAAGRIAHSLQGKGRVLTSPPAGFIVESKEGPLKRGELERAATWAKTLGRARHSLQSTRY